MDNIEKQASSFRVGYVTIVGRPNAGKSTLMNGLLQQKLAIVTPKPQTTRHRILGILNDRDHQIIFLDTPGMMHPKYLLQKTMMKTVRSTMNEADLILMMVDAARYHEQDDEFLTSLRDFHVPKFLILNKIDLVSKDKLLPLIDHFKDTDCFQEIIPISALKVIGLDILISLLLKILPEGDPFYPSDIVSVEPERFFVSEIIREQIFLHYGEEIPYAATIQIDAFEERAGRKDYIRAFIIVEHDSQKGIIIGKGGRALKKVGRIGREHIEEFIGIPVYLDLQVRVKKKWRKNQQMIKNLGY